MARSLSTLLKQSLAAQETGEAAFLLLTISHPSLDVPFRLVRNGAAITSRGNPFAPFPIDVLVPDDAEENAPSAPVTIDNISREIITWLRGADPAPTFLIECVLASTPDTVEFAFGNLTCQEADYDAMTISTNLNTALDPQEPACDFSFSPANFGSLSWVVRSS
jgi:hypothetical protein